MGVSLRLPEDGIPSLLPAADFNSRELTAEDGFLLSRIDGGTNIKALRSLTGWGPDRTDESVAKLMLLKMIQVRLRNGELIELSPKAMTDLKLRLAQGKTGGTGKPAGGGVKEPEAYVLPEGTDTGRLSVEAATHIMRAIERGELGYWYEVLGVSPNADDRTIKRTYHSIAAEIHPDNFYGQDTGVWGERINQAFDVLTRAYDTLSDSQSRAAHDRELKALAEAEAREEEPELEMLDSEPEKQARPKAAPATIVDQIRMKVQKARELARQADQQMNHGHWQEAYSNFQLAAQLDPYNSEYKKQAEFLKPKLNVKKAKQMFEDALHIASGNPRKAIKLLEEVVDIDPARPAHRYEYARLLFQERQRASAMDGDWLEMSKDHCEAALIMEPENGRYLTLFGQILKAKGDTKGAVDALKKALKKDKNNALAKQELEELGK